MPCRCKNCGKPMEDCEFEVCVNCHLEMTDDEVTQNMISGGRFYGEEFKKKAKDGSLDKF